MIDVQKKMVAGGLASYLHYRISAISQEKADEFFLRLQDGANLAADSPVYRLRERLLRSATTKDKLSPLDAAALSIIAWNSFCSGRSIQSLQWRKSGPTAQTFPTILGLGGISKHKPRRRVAA